MGREPARDLIGCLVPSGHMMDHDHARIGTRPEGPGGLGADLVTGVSGNADRLSQQYFILHDIRSSFSGGPGDCLPGLTRRYRHIMVC